MLSRVSPFRMWLNSCAMTQRAARHTDGHIAGCVTGGEGIDAALVVEHVNLRHRHAGGDGHFLDDMAEFQFVGIRRLRVKAASAEEFRHGRAANPELVNLEQTSRRDDDHCSAYDFREHEGMPDPLPKRDRIGDKSKNRVENAEPHHQQRLPHPQPVMTEVLIIQNARRDDAIDHDHHDQHGKKEVKNQTPRPAPGLLLLLEKIHPHAACSMVDDKKTITKAVAGALK
jgi:hypothetical protein